IDRPLDILWCAVVFLGALGELRNSGELSIGQAAYFSTFRFDFAFDQAVGRRIWDQLNVLITDVLRDDVHGDFVELDIVWGDGTGNYCFTHAIGGIHGDLGTIPIGWIQSHSYPCS